MAKARKQTAAERFLGFHSRPGSAAVAPSPEDHDDLPDLAEADVWYSPSSDSHSPTTTAADRGEGGRAASSGGVSAPRRIGGLSRAFADGRQVTSSAPVAVPAWASRFAELSLEDPPEPAAPAHEKKHEEGGADDGWVPPHVYLARRQARASVVEGVGRTLKGRDASRVRDAVWSRTGFPG